MREVPFTIHLFWQSSVRQGVGGDRTGARVGATRCLRPLGTALFFDTTYDA
jgi:hypothetical protein